MMFNKILVMADEGVSIQDYDSLAKYVFKNLNPATDIFFSTGPMDVLDHSCSKMGFGGKMCIDGTAKFEEELSDNYLENSVKISTDSIVTTLKSFLEIKVVNAELVKANQKRIIIPTVYRDDYLGALRRLTRNDDPVVYIRMLQRVQEFSATLIANNMEDLENHITLSNAFKEHDEAKLKIITTQ